MPGQWDYLAPGVLTPDQLDRLVQDLTIAYSLCPPGQVPTPPDRRSVGWSVAALGVRPSQAVIEVIHTRVRATVIAPYDQP